MLELGSYDVNGSTRSLFDTQHYVGVDLVTGPGVDVVADGQSVDYPDATLDVVLSCEVFAHNPFWQEPIENIHRMLKRVGLLIMTCASRGRRKHGTPRASPENSPGNQSVARDYYRNFTAADFDCFDVGKMFSNSRFN